MLLLRYEIKTKIYGICVYSTGVMFTSSFMNISHLVQKLKLVLTVGKAFLNGRLTDSGQRNSE